MTLADTFTSQGMPAPLSLLVAAAIGNSSGATPAQVAQINAIQSVAGNNSLAISTYPGIVPCPIPTWSGTYTAISPTLSMTTLIQAAMNAAAAAGQRLFIDIPVFVSILYSNASTLVVPSGLQMEFGPGGMFITDMLGPPLFGFWGSCNGVSIKNVQILYYQQIWTTDAISPFGNPVTGFGTLTGGSGYTNGTYTNVPLTVNTGPGTGIFVNITVSGGAVTAVTVATAGGGARYSVGQVLTCANTYLGGTGSGWQVLVGTIAQPSVSNWSNAAQNSTQVTQTAYLQNLYNSSLGAAGVNFTGGAKSVNNTNINECAIFSIKGNVSNITINGGYVGVPVGAPACNFIATCVGYCFEWNAGSTVGTGTVQNAANMTMPNAITFKGVTFDGYVMGSVGAGALMVYQDCHWGRYTDAQNSAANDPYALTVGTVGYNFSPPHALYFNTSTAGFTPTYQITDCADNGVYVGQATRRSTSSGILTSLKLSTGGPSYIKGYQSARPDGLAQALGDGNSGSFCVWDMMSGTYNSATTYYVNAGGSGGSGGGFIFPSGNPLSDYRGDITITDTAPIPGAFPVGADISGGHVNVNLRFRITAQDWPLTNLSVTSISGNTVTSSYATNYPGFCLCGTNVKLMADIFFNACTSTATYRGCIANQTAVTIANCIYEFNIHGWRNISSSSSALQQRIALSQTKATNTAVVRDVSNTWRCDYDAGTQEVTWTQTQIITPAASSSPLTTSINFPSNSWGLTRATYLGGSIIGGGNVSVGGPTTISIGSAGTPAALLSGVNPFYSTVTNTPYAAPVASFGAVIATAVGAQFNGTGEFQLSVTGKQVFGS